MQGTGQRSLFLSWTPVVDTDISAIPIAYDVVITFGAPAWFACVTRGRFWNAFDGLWWNDTVLASFVASTPTTVLSATLPLSATNLTVEDCTAVDSADNAYQLLFVGAVMQRAADGACSQVVPAGVDALPGLHSRAVVGRQQRHPHQRICIDA